MKEFFQDRMRDARKILFAALLAVIYILGFGATHLFMWLFHRSLLRDSPVSKVSYWRVATDYEVDRESGRRPS